MRLHRPRFIRHIPLLVRLHFSCFRVHTFLHFHCWLLFTALLCHFMELFMHHHITVASGRGGSSSSARNSARSKNNNIVNDCLMGRMTHTLFFAHKSNHINLNVQPITVDSSCKTATPPTVFIVFVPSLMCFRLFGGCVGLFRRHRSPCARKSVASTCIKLSSHATNAPFLQIPGQYR